MTEPGNPTGQPQETPPPPTTETNREILLKRNKNWQSIARAEAAKKIDEAVKKQTYGLQERGKFIDGIIAEILKKPLDQADEEWRTLRAQYEAMGKDMSGLEEDTKPIADRMKEISRVAEGYVRELIRGAEKGKLTPEILAQMAGINTLDGKTLDATNTRASNLAELLMTRNPALIGALKYALGIPLAEGQAVDSDDSEKKAFATLKDFLSKNKTAYTGNEMPFVWMIISFLDSDKRQLLAQRHITDEKLDQTSAMKFLEAGNTLGAFSPMEIDAIRGALPQLFVTPLPQDKKDQLALAWKLQKDFSKAGKEIIKSSYGSKNQAGEMLTLGNVLLFVAQLAAGVTIAGNVLVGAFKDGSLTTPEGFARLLKNHNILLAAGVLGGAHVLRNKEKIKESLKEPGTQSAEFENKMKRDLYVAVNANPGWREFFGADNYAGAVAFGDYVQSIRLKNTFNPEKLNTGAFAEWLESTGTKDDKLRERYSALATKLKKEGEGVYTVSGAKTDTEEFEHLAVLFSNLAISGAEDGAKARYQTSIGLKVT